MNSLKWSILGPGLIANGFAVAVKEVNGEIYAVGCGSYDSAEAFANQLNNTIALAKLVKSEDNGVYPMVN